MSIASESFRNNLCPKVDIFNLANLRAMEGDGHDARVLAGQLNSPGAVSAVVLKRQMEERRAILRGAGLDPEIIGLRLAEMYPPEILESTTSAKKPTGAREPDITGFMTGLEAQFSRPENSGIDEAARKIGDAFKDLF